MNNEKSRVFFLYLLNVNEVLVVKVSLLLLVDVDLLKFLSNNHDFLFRVFLQSSLSFFLELTFNAFLQTFACFTFELIHLLDVATKLLEASSVLTESKVLNMLKCTISAASRCSALMVFLFICSHISLARSETLTTNSNWEKEYLWTVSKVWWWSQGWSGALFAAWRNCSSLPWEAALPPFFTFKITIALSTQPL